VAAQPDFKIVLLATEEIPEARVFDPGEAADGNVAVGARSKPICGVGEERIFRDQCVAMERFVELACEPRACGRAEEKQRKQRPFAQVKIDPHLRSD
jgi:hypothetical protein